VFSYRQVVLSVMSHHVRGRVVGSTVRPTVGCAVTAEAGFGGGPRRHQHGPEG